MTASSMQTTFCGKGGGGLRMASGHLFGAKLGIIAISRHFILIFERIRFLFK